MLAYPSDLWTTRAATVMPAIRSGRSQAPWYFGAQSKIGITRAIPDGLVEVRWLVTVGPLWSAAR